MMPRSILTGLLLGLAIAALASWTPYLLRTTATLSCQDAPIAGETPYCVYYDERPALFSATYRLTIGREADRGVVYTMPFSQAHIQINWSAETGDLTIALPGSTITVSPSQYIDHR
ncbi:hypothetical protein ACFOEZ_06255 [Tianweitania populi]|uniref:Uncharacterized protein n=1 Tax=Tianweitania populi TaxID=1607949 RepID=A0A8J3GIX2_9HYPH|nr:hypothetical protein [Tianweitania populi]GHD09734.1 hypothetical protein GCM10016234_10790 [Tianweitania populi]